MFKHPPQNLLRSAFTHEHSLTVYAAFWYVNIYNVVINFTSRQGVASICRGLLIVRSLHSFAGLGGALICLAVNKWKMIRRCSDRHVFIESNALP